MRNVILLINTLIIILMYYGCRKQWYHVVFGVGNAESSLSWCWLFFFNVDHANYYADFIFRNVSLFFKILRYKLITSIVWLSVLFYVVSALFQPCSKGPYIERLTFPYYKPNLPLRVLVFFIHFSFIKWRLS